MKIGKPKRKFLVRIIDLDTRKSKNFSVYDAELDLERFHRLLRKSLEKMSKELKV